MQHCGPIKYAINLNEKNLPPSQYFTTAFQREITNNNNDENKATVSYVVQLTASEIILNLIAELLNGVHTQKY